MDPTIATPSTSRTPAGARPVTGDARDEPDETGRRVGFPTIESQQQAVIVTAVAAVAVAVWMVGGWLLRPVRRRMPAGRGRRRGLGVAAWLAGSAMAIGLALTLG